MNENRMITPKKGKRQLKTFIDNQIPLLYNSDNTIEKEDFYQVTVGEAKYTYWKSIIELAKESGMPKKEWCKKNCVSIKTFHHYEGILHRQEARGKEYAKAHPESPFYEIPFLNEEDAAWDESYEEQNPGTDSDEEASYEKPATTGEARQPDATGKETPKRQDPVSKEPETGRMPELAIQAETFRLLVYRGIGEATLRTVMAVVGVGNA